VNAPGCGPDRHAARCYDEEQSDESQPNVTHATLVGLTSGLTNERRLNVFERFTDRARRVVILAQEEGRDLGHGYIGTEHLLLGLLGENEGIAAKALLSLGFTLENLRGKVAVLAPKEEQPPTYVHIPFTFSAKKAMELSLREALELGHNYIGTEHILLGLIRGDDDTKAKELLGDTVKVRAAVISTLGDYTPRSVSPRSVRLAASEPPKGQKGLERLKVLAELIESSSPADRVWLRNLLCTEYDITGEALALD
jgi:hypothetical protein